MKVTVKNYSEHYLICRDLGHAWIEDSRIEKKSGEVGTFRRVLGCGRCNMARIEHLSHRGELLYREYRRPTGYQLDTKVSVVEVRAERIRREKRVVKHAT